MEKSELINRIIYRLSDQHLIEPSNIQQCKQLIYQELENCVIQQIETLPVNVTSMQRNSEAMQWFVLYQAAANKSRRTIETESSVVTRILRELQKPYDEITSDDATAWLIRHKLASGCSDVTLRNYQHYLSSFFRVLHRHGKINHNPMDTVEPIKCQSKVKEVLTDYEVETIKRACRCSRDLAIVTMLLETGMRVSEMCGLDVDAVNLEHRTAVVLGKGNKERVVHFTGKTVFALQCYLSGRSDDGQALFVNKDRPYRRMDLKSVEKMMRDIGQETGVKRLHPHLLRATYATWLAAKGMNVASIAKLLGHNSLNSVQRYVLMDDSTISSELQRIGSAA